MSKTNIYLPKDSNTDFFFKFFDEERNKYVEERFASYIKEYDFNDNEQLETGTHENEEHEGFDEQPTQPGAIIKLNNILII